MQLKSSSDVNALLAQHDLYPTGCSKPMALVTCRTSAQLHTLVELNCEFCQESTEHIRSFGGVGGDHDDVCTRCGRNAMEAIVPRLAHDRLNQAQIQQLRRTALGLELFNVLVERAYDFMADCFAPQPCQHCTNQYRKLAALLPGTPSKETTR